MYYPLLGKILKKEDYCEIDLSENNSFLDFNKTSNPQYLGAFISNELKRNNVQYGVGGYLEKRATYNASENFSNNGQQRDIHLGIDIWTDAYTPIYAPLDGIMHSFKNNDLPYDYGGTIILQHKKDGKIFHTLYGHLSLNSLKGLEKGKEIKAGNPVCQIGDWNENGGWPPHLHFQIINDMQEQEGDYFGAASQLEINYYKSNCPDPSYLIGIEK